MPKICEFCKKELQTPRTPSRKKNQSDRRHFPRLYAVYAPYIGSGKFLKVCRNCLKFGTITNAFQPANKKPSLMEGFLRGRNP